jgi:hypothetical protein
MSAVAREKRPNRMLEGRIWRIWVRREAGIDQVDRLGLQ